MHESDAPHFCHVTYYQGKSINHNSYDLLNHNNHSLIYSPYWCMPDLLIYYLIHTALCNSQYINLIQPDVLIEYLFLYIKVEILHRVNFII